LRFYPFNVLIILLLTLLHRWFEPLESAASPCMQGLWAGGGAVVTPLDGMGTGKRVLAFYPYPYSTRRVRV